MTVFNRDDLLRFAKISSFMLVLAFGLTLLARLVGGNELQLKWSYIIGVVCTSGVILSGALWVLDGIGLLQVRRLTTYALVVNSLALLAGTGLGSALILLF